MVIQQCAAAWDADGVRRTQQQFCDQARRRGVPEGHSALFRARMWAAYLTDDFEGGLKLAGQSGDRMLALAITCGAAGDASEAKRWRKRAREELLQGGADGRGQAAMLAASAPSSADDLKFGADSAYRKALILTVLAQKHPARRDELLPLARRLAYRQGPADRHLRRVLEAMSKAETPPP